MKVREGKLKGAAMEVKSIIEDYEMKAMGGLVAAWELWERALLPSLLAGAGTWLGKIDETVKRCNKIQNFYWRLIFKVPESCPKLALLCETFNVDMKYRIWNSKCQLLLQIKCLDEEALAKQVYEQAEENNWPGLGQEVREICQKIQLPDLNKYTIEKRQIQTAIFEAHHKDMLQQFEKSKKLKDIKDDNFRGLQDYFHDKNLTNARMKFKIRTKMVENVPANFKNRYHFNEIGVNCSSCYVEMTQNHLTLCPERNIMREGLDMGNLDDLVIYFKRYLTEVKKTERGAVSSDGTARLLDAH